MDSQISKFVLMFDIFLLKPIVNIVNELNLMIYLVETVMNYRT